MAPRRGQDVDESVYQLIPKPTTVTDRPPMYRSKYPPDVPPTSSTFGPSSASQILVNNLSGDYELAPRVHRHKTAKSTFGPESTHYSDPTTFLRKSSMPDLPEPTRFEYKIKTKQPLDDHNDVYQKPVASKNFIKENALNIIMSETKKRDTNDLDWTKKADFGKVPDYLDSVKQEIQAEKQYIRQVMKKEEEEHNRYQPKMKLLSEDERQALLIDLKRKWETVNKQYQTITHIVNLDTIGKIRRKEEYEAQLQHLEKSIEKLSKKFVFVHDDY